MRDLARLEATYDELDSFLEQRKAVAQRTDLASLEAKQVLNDQAYFLLLWGQLENEINGACRKAIRQRMNSADWQVRRSWYLYNPDDKRLSGLSFEDRSALVMDRQAGKGSAWAMTMFYYKTRNEVAHGMLHATRIDVSAFVQDCYFIQSALHRAA